MKKIVLAASVFALLGATACKEVGPAVDLSPIKASDTSYMLAAPEAATPKHVLAEEYTGVQCPNCPEGATILKNVAAESGERLVIVALHSGALTEPIANESKYDFRTQQAQDLMTSFFGENANKPAAAIDRVAISGTKKFNDQRSQWKQLIESRLALAAPMNISINSDFNEETRTAIIRVKVSYTATVSKKQSLMVAITEDKIIDAQLNSTVHIPDYEHNHVLRDFLTPVNGSSMMDSLATKTPGRVYERTFIYPVNENWNADNLKIVAFVFDNESNDVEVAQAREADLKQ